MTKDRLTFNEAVEYTGISKTYLYKLTSLKKIRYYKPGGRKIFFMKSDLDTYLMQGVNETKKQ